MTDALATYEPKSDSVWVKFKDGDAVKLRVLTLDPVIVEKEWPNSPGKIDTKYAFTVWNWTENKPMVWQVGSGLLKRLTSIHRDEDFDPLNKVDIKVTATGEMLERRYEVDVMPKPQEMTPDMLKEAQGVVLEDLLTDNRGRMSRYNETIDADQTSGYDKAKKAAKNLKKPDVVIDEMGDEPINLNDIPF